jgi:hypothetical protein
MEAAIISAPQQHYKGVLKETTSMLVMAAEIASVSRSRIIGMDTTDIA